MSQAIAVAVHFEDALVFELSKVETVAIRERLVAHLPNIDEGLAQKVADGLGLMTMPEAHVPAREPVDDLAASDALSILKNGPKGFAGRKLGILVTDGIDGTLLAAVRRSVEDAGGTVEIVAPHVGGIETSDGSRVPADQKIDGAPSVLYDAFAILATADGASGLADMHAARSFLTDAHAHLKFVGVTKDARVLLKRTNLAADAGVIELESAADAEPFADEIGALRFWERMKM